jgi:hypothetical protein
VQYTCVYSPHRTCEQSDIIEEKKQIEIPQMRWDMDYEELEEEEEENNDDYPRFRND